MKYLSEMSNEQTLVMYSGHPLGLFPSHTDAPRVVVTNGMMIPNYSQPPARANLNACEVTPGAAAARRVAIDARPQYYLLLQQPPQPCPARQRQQAGRQFQRVAGAAGHQRDDQLGDRVGG